MKKNLAIMILLFCSCNSSKLSNSKTIPYIFPNKVTSLISEYLIKNGDVNYFYLSKRDNDWVLFLVKCNECETDNNLIKNTNRKVYVNRKFYPLIFNTDEIFSIKENGDYLKSSDDFPSFNRQTFLFHDSYHIIFNQNDMIKYHGL